MTEENAIKLMKVTAKCAWNELPEILAAIPTTTVAGKLLTELKKIAGNIKTEYQKTISNADIDKLIDENGGENVFREKLMEEIKNASTKPVYMNCAIFVAKTGESLSEDDREYLREILFGERQAADDKTDELVEWLISEYFAGDMEACDYPCEIEEAYVAFNFDDSEDHKYSDEDLTKMCGMLNQIVGRGVFEKYLGYGTDTSVEY